MSREGNEPARALCEKIERDGVPDTIDWQQVRIQASIAALNGITSSGSFEQHTLEDVIAECMILADALIAELKKGGNNEDN